MVGTLIVTFNCSKNFKQVFSSAVSQSDLVCIVDNNSGQNTLKFIESLVDSAPYGKVILKSLPENKGLSFAYNLGLNFLVHSGCSDLLILDHDSVLENGYVTEMKRISDKNDNFIFGGNFTDSKSGQKKKYEVFSRFFFHKTNQFLSDLLLVGFVISSGTFMKSSVFKKVGPFIDFLFIDYVDIEYCLRASQFGIRCAVVRDACFFHSMGDSKTHSLSGLKMISKNHLPFRKYFMGRNRVYCWSKFYFMFGFMVWDISALFYDLFRIILLERQKIIKLKQLFRGMWHGFCGQYNNP